MSVEVPKSQHKYVIGPRGSTIAEILQVTGVSVEMPASDSPTGTITLRGPQEKLGQGNSFYYFLRDFYIRILIKRLHKCFFNPIL